MVFNWDFLPFFPMSGNASSLNGFFNPSELNGDSENFPHSPNFTKKSSSLTCTWIKPVIAQSFCAITEEKTSRCGTLTQVFSWLGFVVFDEIWKICGSFFLTRYSNPDLTATINYKKSKSPVTFPSIDNSLRIQSATLAQQFVGSFWSWLKIAGNEVLTFKFGGLLKDWGFE